MPGQLTVFVLLICAISSNYSVHVISNSSQHGLHKRQIRFFGLLDDDSVVIEPAISQSSGVNNNFGTHARLKPSDGFHRNQTTSGLDSESDQLTSAIRLLDEMLETQMRHKKPNLEVSFHLLPKPNFSFLPDLSPLRQLFQWSADSARSYTTCYACKVGFGLFLTKARLKTSLDDVMNQAIFACKFFRIASEEVCSGLIIRFAPTLYFIVTSKTDLTPITFCAMALQSSGCTTKENQIDWDILPHNIFANQLPSVEMGISFSKGRAAQNLRRFGPVLFHEYEVPLNVKTTKILHLTDIHLDQEYSPGSNTECSNELCCRRDDGFGEAGNTAGYFGDYRGCDLPLHSLENALQHISSTHPDIELIYMTGDLVSHEVWKTSIERNTYVIQLSTAMIRKYFPNTRLIPVLGNHETSPVNLYSTFGVPHPLGTDWVYEATAKAWEGWIPKESLHHFLKAGYYDVQGARNLRVVVLNTNLCYTYNFWQIYDGRDPGGQLDWLVKVLLKSEAIGETVHILGHVPPNQNECWFVWSRNFYRIINRFSSTVKAQFYGHTHYDGFHLYYDEKNLATPTSPMWVGASLTPFTNLNPGYKIFYADGSRGSASTWAVLDHETWIYNLTEANQSPHLNPNWFKLYTATDIYEIPNVLPESLDVLVHRMATDLRFFQKYYRNYHKAAEVGLKEECDTICRKRILCNIVTPFFTRVEECLRIEAEIDGVILPRNSRQNQFPTTRL